MLVGICINTDTNEIQDIFWDEVRKIAWYQDMTDNNRYNIEIDKRLELGLDKPNKSLSEDMYIDAAKALNGVGVIFLNNGYINMADYGIGEFYKYGVDTPIADIEWDEDDFEEMSEE